MKFFRSVREFAAAVCREKGQWRPRDTYYIVKDRVGVVRVEKKAPRSYRRLREVAFCVDGDRFVTRKYGVWVESASEWEEEVLQDRQLHEAVDRLHKKDLRCAFLRAPRNLDRRVEFGLNQYLNEARLSLYEEFNRKVIEVVKEKVEEDWYFTLKNRGDLLLNDAVA